MSLPFRGLLSVVLLLAVAVPADGQMRGRPPLPGAAAPPVLTLGVYGGWDTWFDEPLLGAKARVGVPSFPWVALQSAADWTFLQGLTERQVTADVLVDLGGIAVGGGAVFRNSVWDVDNPVRETRTGGSLVLSLGGVPLGRSAFSVGLDYRFIWIEGFRPRPLTLNVTVAPERLF